ncbi:sortase [Candidatus Saccharibacteria bacterium]|nr:sortase [Candidatus Saccharibacteria bacterium]
MRRLLNLKWRLLPLAVALVILSIPVVENIWTRHQIADASNQARTKLQTSSKVAPLQGSPSRILIPSLSIDLPVISQSYSTTTKTWPVESGVANYATETALINNYHGQSLIYGHSTRAVFGKLLDIKPGAEVFVYTSNGRLFEYAYSGSQDVTPRQTEIVADMTKAPAGLKMMTCDGPYFEYRRLMSFKLIKSA